MADYVTLDSMSLGNYTNYKSSVQQKVDVVFQPDLSSGYYSVLALNSDDDYGVGYDLSNDLSDNMVDTDISGNTLQTKKSKQTNPEKSLYSIGTSPVNGFFIGSVTVLGLFLLYKLLKK